MTRNSVFRHSFYVFYEPSLLHIGIQRLGRQCTNCLFCYSIHPPNAVWNVASVIAYTHRPTEMRWLLWFFGMCFRVPHKSLTDWCFHDFHSLLRWDMMFLIDPPRLWDRTWCRSHFASIRRVKRDVRHKLNPSIKWDVICTITYNYPSCETKYLTHLSGYICVFGAHLNDLPVHCLSEKYASE